MVNRYVVMDLYPNIPSTANQVFYDKCIKTKELNDLKCNLVLKQIDHSCLPVLLYAASSPNYTGEGNHNVKGLGKNYIFRSGRVYSGLGNK